MLAASIFFLSGLMCLALSLYLVLKNHKTNQTGIRVEGEVVKMRETRSRTKQIMYQPIYEFIDFEGKKRRYFSRTSSSSPSKRIGETEKLIYRADDAKEVLIDSFSGIYGTPILLLFMGVIFTAVGVFLFIKN